MGASIGPIVGLLKEQMRHRALLLELVRRDIRGRFVGARFGLFWSLINPAVQLGAYSALFGHIYDKRGFSSGPVVASLFCGLWPWWAFQEGSMRGASAIVDQGALLRRTPIPPAVCVVAAATASVLLQMIGFLLFLVIFALSGTLRPHAGWLLLPLLMVLTLALCTGVGLVSAPLLLVVRDVAHVLGAVMLVGFFASPVLYDISALPGSIKYWQLLNPVATLLGLFRSVVLGVPAPAFFSIIWLLIVIGVLWRVSASLLHRIDGQLDEFL